jgi:hypothetical protein
MLRVREGAPEPVSRLKVSGMEAFVPLGPCL